MTELRFTDGSYQTLALNSGPWSFKSAIFFSFSHPIINDLVTFFLRLSITR